MILAHERDVISFSLKHGTRLGFNAIKMLKKIYLELLKQVETF